MKLHSPPAMGIMVLSLTRLMIMIMIMTMVVSSYVITHLYPCTSSGTTGSSNQDMSRGSILRASCTAVAGDRGSVMDGYGYYQLF